MALKTLLVAALAAPALASVVPQLRAEGKIVGGEAADTGEFPSIVSIQTGGDHICGGSLLNSNTVITAAHCSDFKASEVQVRGGTNDWAKGGKLVNVDKITIHPKYNKQTFDYDVAIWKLSAPIKSCNNNVAFAKIADKGNDPSSGSSLEVAGWGYLKEDGDVAPNALQKVTVPVVSRDDCNKDYGTGSITSQMFCAGAKNGGIDSCQGDSGGPIFDKTSGVQIGVVSWGNGCARPGYPGVYSNIGALTDFISANV